MYVVCMCRCIYHGYVCSVVCTVRYSYLNLIYITVYVFGMYVVYVFSVSMYSMYVEYAVMYCLYLCIVCMVCLYGMYV